MAVVKKDGKCGYIDKTGKEVVECKYDDVYSFSEGMAVVKKDGKYDYDWKCGYIDKTGKEVVECKYDFASNFSEGMAIVRKDEKYGFIDKTGKEVVECQYDAAWDFAVGGLATRVEKDGKWGFIDKTGKEVVECQYDDVWSSARAMALVSKDGECYIINTKGEICNPNEIISQDSTVNEDKTSNRIKSIAFRPTEYLKGDLRLHSKYWGYNFTGTYYGTSELVEGEKTYCVDNLSYRDISSWVEGIEGYGIGEKLEINIIGGKDSKYDGLLCAYAESNGDIDKIKDYYYHLEGFYIVNGFAKNESLWEANSRVKKIKLAINDTKEYIVDLEDTRAIQYIDVDYKINNIVEPIKVVAEILEVYEGDKYEDTALSLFEPDYETNISWVYWGI